MKIFPICSVIAFFWSSGLSGQCMASEHSVNSVLWQQHSAEYRALCHQAFNSARDRLDHLLKDGGSVCIYTDIDETILDNSPFNAEMIEQGDWHFNRALFGEWVGQYHAESVPGAVDFFEYASKNDSVSIFYISNRNVSMTNRTKENLLIHGIEVQEKDTFLLRTTVKEKDSRRAKAKEKCGNRSGIFIGDNASDFDDGFEWRKDKLRSALADELKENWAEDFFILPNPMYGDWESEQVLSGSASISESSEKRQLKINELKGFKSDCDINKSTNSVIRSSFGPRLNVLGISPINSLRDFEFTPIVNTTLEFSFLVDNTSIMEKDSCSKICRKEQGSGYRNAFFNVGHNLHSNSSYVFGGFNLHREGMSKSKHQIPIALVGLVNQYWANGTTQVGAGVSLTHHLAESGRDAGDTPELVFFSIMYTGTFGEAIPHTGDKSPVESLSFNLIIPVNLTEWGGFRPPLFDLFLSSAKKREREGCGKRTWGK